MIYFFKNNFSIRMLWTLKKYTSFGFVTAEFYYLELYKAVLNGNWESASKLLEDDSWMLHIAVELGEAWMGFVEKLVEFMPSDKLDLRDSDDATALFNAVRAGNIKAAQLLVNKKSDLPNICNRHDFASLHSAVRYGHKELTLYLLSVTRALICISFLKFAWNRTSAQSTNGGVSW